MRKTVGILMTAALALVWSGLAWSGEELDARALVAKAIKAAGGEERMAKFNAATWKETGKYYGMGDGLPFTGKYAMQLPDKFRMEIEGIFILVMNGDKGWIHMNGETKEMAKEQLAAQKSDHRAGLVATLLPLKDKAFALAAIGEAKVEDKPAQGIRVTRKDYPEVKLYFDKKTHLLVKAEFPSKSPEQGFKDVTSEMYYSNYKDIDGARIPTRLVLKRDGKLFVEADVEDMKPAGKLADSMFGMP
jgi:hypothetical protein